MKLAFFVFSDIGLIGWYWKYTYGRKVEEGWKKWLYLFCSKIYQLVIGTDVLQIFMTLLDTIYLIWFALILIYLFRSVILGSVTNDIPVVISVFKVVGSTRSSWIGQLIKNSLKSHRKCYNVLLQLNNVIYSAFDELNAIIVCRIDKHDTGIQFMVKNIPDVERWVPLQPTQSAFACSLSELELIGVLEHVDVAPKLTLRRKCTALCICARMTDEQSTIGIDGDIASMRPLRFLFFKAKSIFDGRGVDAGFVCSRMWLASNRLM